MGDLVVFQESFVAGKRVFELSNLLPPEEMFSLTGQVRPSAPRVTEDIVEAWRTCRNEQHFYSTLEIAEAEAAKTRVWNKYAAAQGAIDAETTMQATEYYAEILRMSVKVIHHSSRSRIDFETSAEQVTELTAEYSMYQAALLAPSFSTSSFSIPSFSTPSFSTSSLSTSSLSTSSFSMLPGEQSNA